MSSRKNVLTRFQAFTAGVMSNTTLTSPATNIQYLDDIGVQLNWTGSPTGTFAIQVSADYQQDQNGNVITAGNWVPLTLTYFNGANFTNATSIPTSVGSPVYLDLSLLSAPWIRLVYTGASGSGTLNAFITAKEV